MAKNNINFSIQILKERGPLEEPSEPKLSRLHEGILLHQLKQFSQAEEIYRQVLEIEPTNSDALHLLGVIAHQTSHHQRAVDLIRLAIEINPYVASYHSNMGTSLKELKQVDAAIASYDKAIALKPDYAEAFYNRGNAFKVIKNLNAAIASFDQAIALKPDYAEAYSNRGNALQDLKQYAAAVASFEKAIALKPAYAEAYYNRGNALQDLKQYVAAVASYEKAIAIKPDYAEAYSNRGNSLQKLNQLEAAIASYDKAIELKPDYAEAYSNQGNSLKELKQFDAAIASYDKAVLSKPDFAEAYYNRGNALQELKQLETADANYDKAIALKPNYAEAYFNKSLLLLLVGEYCQGFNSYESRWEKEEILEFKRNFPQPLWVGEESLSGKTILLHAEQGLGDTIQFCRYAQMVGDLGAKVILEVQKPLVRLLKDLPGVSALIAKGDPLPEFDFHCPLLSLPLAFRTDLKSIPNAKRYLKAEPERVSFWKDRLTSDEFKIGVGWQGSQGTKIDIGRSFELKLFRKIAALHNVKLISLQKGYGSEQLKSVPQGMKVINLGDELDADGAFLDSAAVMMNLDLFITSDTALAHLAGALGIKTWVVLKYVPDWRWMLDRKDSPWYPTVTLYRQQSMDDWPPVFDQMLIDINLMR
jgi:tetratricopeptide (TPR) repeat protein